MHSLDAPSITRYSNRGEASHSRDKLAQNVMQNAAVLEIFKLVEGIDPADERHSLEPAVGSHDLRDHPLARLDLAVQAADRDLLVPPQAQRLPGRAFLEAQREHAHPDEIGSMDALEGLANDRAHAEQVRTLRRPVARRAAAVFLAGKEDQRNIVALVAHGRIEDRHALP